MKQTTRSRLLGSILAALTVAAGIVAAPAALAAGNSPVVSTGPNHTCAIAAEGTLWCWGFSGPNYSSGYLGDGTELGSELPVQVGSDTDWSTVSVGWTTTCAVKTDHSLYCWGWNGQGQLGVGADAVGVSSLSPVRVGTDTDWSVAAVGSVRACALKLDETLYCWGSNSTGALGDGTLTNHYTPTLVGPGYVSISVGGGHACAVDLTTALFCWGDNGRGEIGDGTIWSNRLAPVKVIDANVASVSAGYYSTCATMTDHVLSCWGDNAFGQAGTTIALGDQILSVLTPTALDGSDWDSVSTGDQYTCATKTSGDLYCWGRNRSGELTDGTPDELPHAVPVQLSAPVVPVSADLLGMVRPLNFLTTFAGSGWASVSTAKHGCGVIGNGSIACWGDNSAGGVGTGTVANATAPVTVALSTTATFPTVRTVPSTGATLVVGRMTVGDQGSWIARTTPTYTYAWYRCTASGAATSSVPSDCRAIRNATAQRYTPVSADANKRLRLSVIAQNSAGSARSLSAASDPVLTPLSTTARPTVTGAARVGSTLRATSGSFSGSGPISYAYAWYSCSGRVSSVSSVLRSGCALISGVQTSSILIGSAQRGSYLLVAITATNGAGSVTRYSATSSIIK